MSLPLMNKNNSNPNFFESSIESLLNMRQFAQYYPKTISCDSLNKDQFKMNDDLGSSCNDNSEYILPSPSIHIETIKKNTHLCDNKKSKSNRFSFLMSDIRTENKSNNNEMTFKMKYELPNIQSIHSPIKANKPIQVVSFVKK